MTELGGTRALVTGATSGLGLAMARALVDAGARVVITSRDAERARHAAAALGPVAVGLALDARNEGAVAAGVATVWERLGGIDLLVNNAGVGMRIVNPRFLSDPQPFWEVPPDGFRDVLETKATGCFLMARAVVPLMLEQGGGRIVTISFLTLLKAITNAGLKAEIWGFGRALKADIDELLRLGSRATVIETPTSAIKLRAIVASPSSTEPNQATLRLRPLASITDAMVKPSGILCRKTAKKISHPSQSETMKPEAMAMPSKKV